MTRMILRSAVWVSAMILWLGVAGGAQGALITSTFDSDAEGWRVRTLVAPIDNPPSVVLDFAPPFISTGGNPGGFIRTNDPDGNNTYFSAPAMFLGDKSSFQGGTLSWDTRDLFNDELTSVLAILVGSDRTLFSVQGGPPPQTDWGSFSLNLSPSDWLLNSDSGPPASASDIAAVLGNLQNLYIEADWQTGGDQTDLDNVRLQSPAAVPEPAALTIWTLGALGCAVAAYRRRKRAA